MRRLRTDGRRDAARRRRTGARTAARARRLNLVFLHASQSCGARWRSLAEPLAGRCRVIAPELDTGSVATDAACVLRAVDAAAGPGSRFHAFGHGYGGIVALELARRHAPRMEAATLYEPTCFDLLADQSDREFVGRVVRAVELLAGRGLEAGAARMFHDFWHGPGAFDARDAAERDALAARVPALLPKLRAALAAGRDYAGIGVPVRLVGGRRSFRLTRRVLEALAAALPVATLAWVDGDHMAPLDEPAKFLEAIACGGT